LTHNFRRKDERKKPDDKFEEQIQKNAVKQPATNYGSTKPVDPWVSPQSTNKPYSEPVALVKTKEIQPPAQEVIFVHCAPVDETFPKAVLTYPQESLIIEHRKSLDEKLNIIKLQPDDQKRRRHSAARLEFLSKQNKIISDVGIGNFDESRRSNTIAKISSLIAEPSLKISEEEELLNSIGKSNSKL